MIKEGDFIEINYTGKLKDMVFDTTQPEVAKKSGLPGENLKPIRICVGKGSLLKGIEESIIGKEVGDKFSIVLEPEKAFGKKTAKNIQLVPISKFKKDGVNPQAGMKVQIDGKIVVIKRVGGGRVLVDFNHPLAGKEVNYDISIERLVSDTKEKLEMFIPIKFEYDDSTKTVEIDKIPVELRSKMEKQIKDNVPEVIKVNFKGD